MPRNAAPSLADQVLLAYLAEVGAPCSRHQLERWRQHGLLPRAHVHHLGARGNRATYGQDTRDIATALAVWSRPGRSWQYLACLLMVHPEPELWYAMPMRTVRGALTWTVQRGDAHIDSRIARVLTYMDEHGITERDPLAIAEAVVAMRGSRSDRQLLAFLLPILQGAYPELGVKARRRLAREQITWAVAQHLGEELEHDTKALAAGFASYNDLADSGFADLPIPQSAHLLQVAGSITWREFRYALRAWRRIPDITPAAVCHGLVTMTAAHRLLVHQDATEPLPADVLAQFYDYA